MKLAYGLAFGVSLAALAGASTAHAALPSYITNEKVWLQGTPIQGMGDAGTNFCYLTHVSGKFVGAGEWVRVWSGDPGQGDASGVGIGPSPGTTWWVGGSSQQANGGEQANSMCIAYSSFVKESASSVDWTGWLSETTGALDYVNPTNCGNCFIASVGGTFNVWQGDAAVTLSGVSGQFQGGGEYIQIAQAGNGTAFNTATLHAESYNGISGWVQGLFVGVPQSGFNPSFYGPNAGPAQAVAAGTYTASASALFPTKTVVMAPTNKAICYLSGISGAFFGGGESVDINTVQNDAGQFWELTVNSQQDAGTAARATCYALDQSVNR